MTRSLRKEWKRFLWHWLATMACLIMALFVAACGDINPSGSGRDGEKMGDAEPRLAPSRNPSAPIKIVATTGMVGDIIKNIVRERGELTVLMGEGIDPHLYKPAPSDMHLLNEAEVIVHNGLHLEGKMEELLEKVGRSKPVIAVSRGLDSESLRRPAEFQGHPDPHIWFDVALWSKCVGHVRDEFIRLDSSHAAEYEQNALVYLQELSELDRWCREEIEKIPRERRMLVTAHDAFGYFGRAYGIEVHGIQGISTDSEASIRDMNALVDLLVERKVPAVFVESSVPRKTIDALIEGCASRGHKVVVGGELFSDAMGREGTPEGTYIGMVRHNVNVIVKSLRSEQDTPEVGKKSGGPS